MFHCSGDKWEGYERMRKTFPQAEPGGYGDRGRRPNGCQSEAMTLELIANERQPQSIFIHMNMNNSEIS